MKKKIIAVKQGHRADVGEYQIFRVLPNHEVRAIGPFVFLDYVPMIQHPTDEPRKTVDGRGAHPHRGIATLTYVLNGEADHFDSNGHHAKVYSGGAQWMKAGTGIIHDESMNPDPHTGDGLTQGFQFWVNLPAANKAEQPDYLPVQANELPVIIPDNNAGYLKVVIGEYNNLRSPIPTYSEQFIYHIRLAPGKTFRLDTKANLEYAAFLPVSSAVVNDIAYRERDLLLFDSEQGVLELQNPVATAIDIIVFGGARYTEPIVAEGPFVMNTYEEIETAYTDARKGKYGKIKYDQQAINK